MDLEILAPMVITVVLILTVGGVMLLRPISKRVGDLLEVYARERQEGLQGEVQQVRDLLETLTARLELLEDRQDFAERLLTGKREQDKGESKGA